MAKSETKLMQGVAIMIMIFYHLFNPSDVQNYNDTLIGSVAKVNNPVPLYVILSGIGLYYKYRQGNDGNKLKRCFSLYLRFWTILTLFLLVGLAIGKKYNLDFITIVLNYTVWHSGYYLPAWFILPYVILALGYNFIFRFFDKLNLLLSIFVFYGIYLMSSYLNSYLFFRLNVFQTFYIVFPFIVGAIIAKYNVVSKIKDWFDNKNAFIPYILILLLVILRYFVPTGAVISFYYAALIILVSGAKKHVLVQKVLLSLGKASVNMWLIHAWLCWYLFSDFFYSLGNPALIFIAVTLVSYLLSKCFDALFSLIPIFKKTN